MSHECNRGSGKDIRTPIKLFCLLILLSCGAIHAETSDENITQAEPLEHPTPHPTPHPTSAASPEDAGDSDGASSPAVDSEELTPPQAPAGPEEPEASAVDDDPQVPATDAAASTAERTRNREAQQWVEEQLRLPLAEVRHVADQSRMSLLARLQQLDHSAQRLLLDATLEPVQRRLLREVRMSTALTLFDLAESPDKPRHLAKLRILARDLKPTNDDDAETAARRDYWLLLADLAELSWIADSDDLTRRQAQQLIAQYYTRHHASDFCQQLAAQFHDDSPDRSKLWHSGLLQSDDADPQTPNRAASNRQASVDPATNALEADSDDVDMPGVRQSVNTDTSDAAQAPASVDEDESDDPWGLYSDAWHLPLIDGQVWHASMHRGRVLLVHIWSSDDPQSLAMIEPLRREHAIYRAHNIDVDLLSVNLDEDEQVMHGQLEETPYAWPTYHPVSVVSRKKILDRLSAQGPGLVLVGRDGRIAGHPQDLSAARKAIPKLLSQPNAR